MNALRIILGSIYPILIILLLLKMCSKDTQGTPAPVMEEPADSALVRQAEDVGMMGDLKITLLWSFYADIDLHVLQPNGVEIYFSNNNDSSTGGSLDVDNRNGGANSAENIYWQNPPNGEYQVSLVYFGVSTKTRTAESGVCTVVVFKQGEPPRKFDVEMKTLNEKKNVVSFVL